MFDISSKHIDIFLEAARTLNFTQAAENLYTTQSTISRTIRQLEDEIFLFCVHNN